MLTLLVGGCGREVCLRLSRQIRTDQPGGFQELIAGNLNPFAPFCVAARIVSRASLAARALKRCELRRSDTPVTSFLPGHDMEMIVRRFLSAVDAVVLEREDSERLVCLQESLCDSFGCAGDGATFFIGKVQQRRDVSTCDHAALTDLELPWVYDGERKVAFLDDCPSRLSTTHPLAKIAEVFCWKLDQQRSPTMAVARPARLATG